jgi:hypothetical protein
VSLRADSPTSALAGTLDAAVALPDPPQPASGTIAHSSRAAIAAALIARRAPRPLTILPVSTVS